jgi:hypothetical protein
MTERFQRKQNEGCARLKDLAWFAQPALSGIGQTTDGRIFFSIQYWALVPRN